MMTTETKIHVETDKYGTRYRTDDNCATHGPFENTAFAPGTHNPERLPRWIGCPKCSEEREAERKRAEREELRLKLLADRIARSGIPQRRFGEATLDSYTATSPGQKKALAVAKSYAGNFRKTFECGKSLLLLGNVGNGKTHLAVGIAYEAMKQGAEVIFTTAADMIGKVKATWGQRSGDSEAEVIERFASVDLLILDELGSIKCSGREWELLFSILGKRHNEALPTIFTANLKPDELPAYLGEQIVSRLREGGSQRIVFDWDDYRVIKGKQALANWSETND